MDGTELRYIGDRIVRWNGSEGIDTDYEHDALENKRPNALTAGRIVKAMKEIEP